MAEGVLSPGDDELIELLNDDRDHLCEVCSGNALSTVTQAQVWRNVAKRPSKLLGFELPLGWMGLMQLG